MRSEEAFQESVRSMRNQTLRADRAGDYWTDDDWYHRDCAGAGPDRTGSLSADRETGPVWS